MQNRNKAAEVDDIRCEALYLEQRLQDMEPEGYPRIAKAFEALADRLYETCSDVISRRQYETARDNVDYFMVLVERTLAHYEEER
jgi:hypothetical protein